jgi:lipopolysaccharide export system permease protein
MIKKLDLLIIRAFIGPFFGTFLISVFVLVLQFFWLYLDDLVGKGLNSGTLFYMIGLVALFWIPLALPLSLLLSSIMTFGNLGETFEIVAIKAAGIPLLRFMRPLLIITIFISGLAFVFANNIIPFVQLKLETLKHNIITKQPAFDIKEGVFYDKIPGYSIKVGKKEKDDSTIRNIIIYEKTNSLQDNILIAESGVMRVSDNKQFLEFILKNGWRYQEKGQAFTTNTDYIRFSFKEYKKTFDLSVLDKDNANEQAFQYEPKMLSARQLSKAIDSLKKIPDIFYKRVQQQIDPYINYTKFADTGWVKVKKDSLKKVNSFAKLIPDSLKNMVYERSMNNINAAAGNMDIISKDYTNQVSLLRLNEIEWHRKFTLSVACFVLFLIGAPLGSIIRKGGLGMPLVLAVIFFALFHLLNTFGEKFSKEGVTSSFGGMWLSTFVLAPVGMFLVYKAMKDSQLFNKEFYFRFFKKMKHFFSTFKSSNKSV